jgi:hypothetical protein
MVDQRRLQLTGTSAQALVQKSSISVFTDRARFELQVFNAQVNTTFGVGVEQVC